MSKKNQKLKPDVVLKEYWRDNGHFADFFNAVLFKGEQLINPEELEDIDTDESSVIEHREYAESMIAARDVVKVHKTATVQGAELVLLGIENQEHIHYAMPMRVMGYDYGSYKKQYDDNTKKYEHTIGLDEDEFLSKMKKTDRFIPVITIVIYYGDKAWDGAVSLHDMLCISEPMKSYVNDYKMLLVEARKNDLVFHNMNNKDLFNLLQIILDRSLSKRVAKQKAIEYSEKHATDKSVVMTVAGTANLQLNYNDFAKGAGTMCNLFDEIKKEGKLEGKLEGEAKGIVESGIEFGISESDILERLQRKLNITLQEAKEYFQMFGKVIV